MPRPTDELWERTRRLQAERLRVEKPLPATLPPPVVDLQKVIATLARWMNNPGPPDPAEESG